LLPLQTLCRRLDLCLDLLPRLAHRPLERRRRTLERFASARRLLAQGRSEILGGRLRLLESATDRLLGAARVLSGGVFCLCQPSLRCCAQLARARVQVTTSRAVDGGGAEAGAQKRGQQSGLVLVLLSLLLSPPLPLRAAATAAYPPRQRTQQPRAHQCSAGVLRVRTHILAVDPPLLLRAAQPRLALLREREKRGQGGGVGTRPPLVAARLASSSPVIAV
jgi:hypothetical protein